MTRGLLLLTLRSCPGAVAAGEATNAIASRASLTVDVVVTLKRGAPLLATSERPSTPRASPDKRVLGSVTNKRTINIMIVIVGMRTPRWTGWTTKARMHSLPGRGMRLSTWTTAASGRLDLRPDRRLRPLRRRIHRLRHCRLWTRPQIWAIRGNHGAWLDPK